MSDLLPLTRAIFITYRMNESLDDVLAVVEIL
jgi:hypothetical protein